MFLHRLCNASARGWSASALVLASCAGNVFTGGTGAGTSDTGSAGVSTNASISGSSGGAAVAGLSAGGAASSGASSSADAGVTDAPLAGATSNGNAGATSNGAAGSSGNPECQALDGYAFGGHCYLDATVTTLTQAQAVSLCRTVPNDTKLSGHLLVLDTDGEQRFVLQTFMRAFEDVSDAWLGLTCDSYNHPDINDCYCADCKAELPLKQQAWTWLGGASSTFGWVNGNPNAAFRCSALAWNSELMIWGWVDRACDKTSGAPIAGHVHDYRTICEFEP